MREKDRDKSFKKVSKIYTPDVTEYREAAHAMFFAKTDKKLSYTYKYSWKSISNFIAVGQISPESPGEYASQIWWETRISRGNNWQGDS